MAPRFLTLAFAMLLLIVSLAAPAGAQDLDCEDLTFEEAQELLQSNPEAAPQIDPDDDGIACEGSPSGGDSADVGSDDGNSLCVVTEEELNAVADAPVEPDADPLEGRLGGPLDAFKAAYHQDNVFRQEGCSNFGGISSQPSADGSFELVTVIDLWADRDADIEAGTLDNPSDANWTQEEATVIARQLVPTDTVFEGEFQMTEAGNLILSGYSESLATATTHEHYSYHGSDGAPGSVEVMLFLSSDGTVWNVVVQLGGINS